MNNNNNQFTIFTYALVGLKSPSKVTRTFAICFRFLGYFPNITWPELNYFKLFSSKTRFGSTFIFSTTCSETFWHLKYFFTNYFVFIVKLLCFTEQWRKLPSAPKLTRSVAILADIGRSWLDLGFLKKYCIIQ